MVRIILYTALIAIFASCALVQSAASWEVREKPLGVCEKPVNDGMQAMFSSGWLPRSFYYKDIAALATIGEVTDLVGIEPEAISAKVVKSFLYTHASIDTLKIGKRPEITSPAYQAFAKSPVTQGTVFSVEPYLCKREIEVLRQGRVAMADFSADQKHDCYLLECIEAFCPLTRFCKPKVRAFFEDKIAEIVPAQVLETYVAFACGGLSQDLRVLSKLAERGTSIKRIVLIDPIYTNLLEMYGKTSLCLDMRYPIEEAIDWKDMYQNLCANAESSDVPESAFEAVLLRYTQMKRINQYMHVLNELNVGEELLIYKEADDYIHDYTNNPSIKPSLLTCCDIAYLTDEQIREQELLLESSDSKNEFQKTVFLKSLDLWLPYQRLSQNAGLACVLARNYFAKEPARNRDLFFEIKSQETSEPAQWRYTDSWMTPGEYDALYNDAMA